MCYNGIIKCEYYKMAYKYQYNMDYQYDTSKVNCTAMSLVSGDSTGIELLNSGTL